MTSGSPHSLIWCRLLVGAQILAVLIAAALGPWWILPVAVVLVVPLLLLRRGRRTAWLTLLIAEVLVAFGTLLGLAFAFVFAVLPIASCVAAIILLASPPISTWAQEPTRLPA
jgi:hypothetical protein